MPANTVKVDRSTKWGNPFKKGEFAVHPKSGKRILVQHKNDAISLFALYLQTPAGSETAEAAATELRGKNLACWCKVGDACHADVLIQLANETRATRKAA